MEKLAEVKRPFEIAAPGVYAQLKMMVYGPYGVGKTRFAATATDVNAMRDVLFIDAEAGSLTLRPFADRVDVVRVTSFKQFARVYDFLKLHRKLVAEGNEEKLWELQRKVAPTLEVLRKYNTVVIDSLTEVYKFAMYQILGTEVGDVPLDMEPTNPQWAEWGKAGEMTRLLIRSFRDLDMHVIFVAAEQEKEDELKRVRRMPALPGKLAKESQGFMDVVGYLRMVQVDGKLVRRLFLQPTDKFDAKDRYHAEQQVQWVDDPTMEKFLTLKEEEKEENNG